MIKSLRFLFFIIPFFFTSCEKKFLEIVPVTEKVEDLSIPNAGNIKHFSFPSNSVGYAASDTNFIYKTTDGGKSWKQVFFNNSLINSHAKCKNLEFYDEQNGICYLEDSFFLQAILITNNGGATWTYTESLPLAGITKDGKAYACKYNLSTRTCLIKESTDKGKTFKNLISLYIEDEFKKSKVIGSSIYIVNEVGTVHGYNPVTSDTLRYFIGTTFGLTPMNDFLFNGWINVAVGQEGIIKGGGGNDSFYNSLHTEYDNHDYPYYSVDSYQDLAIAVGKKTMATNINTQDGESWHEIYDSNGNSFPDTFYKVKFINDQYFYVSGEKGLIWKMKI